MCKFEVDISLEEVEAMNWLGEVMDAIRRKGPEHRSYQNAKNVVAALNKINSYCKETHDRLHEQEHRLNRLVAASLYTQEWGDA